MQLGETINLDGSLDVQNELHSLEYAILYLMKPMQKQEPIQYHIDNLNREWVLEYQDVRNAVRR